MTYKYNLRQLKRINQILDDTAVAYTNPQAAHFMLKLDSVDCLRYFATYMSRRIKQQYSYAVSYEYKQTEVGLHAHIMLVVDAVGRPVDMLLHEIRKVFADLAGVRIVDGTASASLECRKVKGNKSLKLIGANGKIVYSHNLKTDLVDAKDRFSYLAKTDQKHGLKKKRTFNSHLKLPECVDILDYSEVHECDF